jgi:hypothetical protein
MTPEDVGQNVYVADVFGRSVRAFSQKNRASADLGRLPGKRRFAEVGGAECRG